MPEATPPWLSTMQQITGTKWAPGEGTSPTIVQWLQFIGGKFPETASYCASVVHDEYFSWCGLTVGYCMAQAGIAPVFGTQDTSRFLWAMAWLGWGTPASSPQAGDVLVFDFGGGDHHVTLFEKDNGDGTWACRGGNQSHEVRVTNFPKSKVMGIRRPNTAATMVSTAASSAASMAVAAAATATQRFNDCVALVLRDEGGNDDDPRDPGGRTSRGITQREWDAWRQMHPGLPADVWQAPQDQVLAIYHEKYWNVLQCDQLPAGVDYAVFDYGVLSGVGRSAKILQGFVGVAVDGEIGPITIAATARASAAGLIGQICDERLAFMQSLSTWPTFGHGWTNRVQGVRAAALRMASASASATATQSVPAGDLISLIRQLVMRPEGATAPPQQTTTSQAKPDLVSLLHQILTLTQPQQQTAGSMQAQGDVAGLLQQILKLTQPPQQTTGAAPPQPDLAALLQQILKLAQSVGGGATGQPNQPQINDVIKILSAVAGVAGQSGALPLGQVNGALGQTIGNLLNGSKSAIGIIGALATSVLGIVGPNLPLDKIIPALGSTAGLSQVAMPFFLAIAAWGVLGKLEKWLQGGNTTAAPPAATK